MLSATAVALCKGLPMRRVKKQEVEQETFIQLQKGGVFQENITDGEQCSNPQVW